MQNLSSSPRQVLSTILYIVLVVACFHILASPADAATGINKQINFQGKVVNTNGTNVANGDYDFVFKIYTVSSGGAAVWTETWDSGTSQVTVTDGVFRVSLGTHTSLPGSIDFNTDNIYLGVEFEGDGEMTPRVRFTAVPYAFNALKVAGLTVTDTTGTFTLANGKTLTVNNTLSFSGTDSTAFTLPSSSDTLVGLDVAQTLTNKTLTAPKFADGGFLADASGNELLVLDSNASAVNEITLANAATGNGVSLAATGGDTDVAFSIRSKAAGALTLDSGTTGTVNLGTSNNAKTINIGTGTAGNTINIGTNNTTSDTISIGSALDNVAITGDDWSITSAGALTVASCSGCGGAAGADTALSNLASVAINTSLLPGTDDSIDLGDNTHRFRDLYLAGDTAHIGTSTTDEGTISYNTTTNVFHFGTDSTTNGDIAFFTDDLYLDKSAGSVGIGTTAPGALLEIDNSAGTGSSAGMIIDADTADNAYIYFYEEGSQLADIFWHGSSNYLAINSGTNDTIISSANQSVVGIGSTAPDAKLEINSLTGDNLRLTYADGNGGATDYADFSTTSSGDLGIDTSGNDINIAAGDNLNMVSGAGIFTQTFSGTTTDAFNIAAASLTTGSVLDIDATNTATTNTAIQQARLDLVNAQSTLANTSFVGLGINFTNNPSVAGNTEYAFQIQNQLTANTTDNAIAALLRLDNADTTASGTSLVTDAILITDSGGAGFTNFLNTPTVDISAAGAISGVTGYSQGSGTFTLTAADASLINLSAVNVSGTGEGLILPQNATACSAATAEGQICWDTAGEDLYVGNGSAAVQINGAGGGANTALSNLASVAINTTLVSDTDVTDDLGTSAVQWRQLFVGGDQTTSSYGIQFGATNPVNLYRSGANTLATDDNFSLTSPNTTGTGTSSSLSIAANSLTTGNALNISSTSVTSGRLFNIAPSFAGNGVTGYGVFVDAVDSTANGNTDYGMVSNVTLSNDAAKTAYGFSTTLSSSSTTADALYGGAFNPGASGAISSGNRAIASLYLFPNASGANSGGTTSIYGIYANPTSTNSTTGSTTDVYGAYIVPTSVLTSGGTLTSYGIRIRNNTTIDGTGTTTQYGLYLDSIANADTNFAIYSAGGQNALAGNTRIGSTTAPTVALDVTGAALISSTLGVSGAITAPTSSNTINSLVINSGALSGITGYTQGSGTMSITTNATTGTGSSSGLYLNADTVTSGNGLYINAAGLIANGSAEYINATSAITSGTVLGAVNVLSATNSSASTASFLGIRGQAYVNNSAALNGVAAGIEGVATNANSQTIYQARGIQGFVNQSHASGTITNGRAFFGQIQNTTGTIGTGTGLYIADASSNGTLTTQYGVYIDALTKGGTNVALCFDCDGTWTASTVASGIQFGSDANAVNIYRSASDTLKTDDALVVGNGVTISGTTDITTGTDENLTITANGTGDVVVSGDADTNFQVTFSAAPGVDMAVISNASQGATATGVDGLSIVFETAGTTASADNAGLRVEVTSNNSGTTTTLEGIYIADLASAEANSTETALRIGANWDRGLVIESGGSTNSGLVYSGAGRPTKTVTLSPEYLGAVITAFYGAGTDSNITGSMTADTDTTQGTSIRNYYQWEAASGTQQFYTVAVRITLPKDFSAWATSNAVVINYKTENATDTNSDVDARIYNENSATIVASDTDNASTSWTTIVFDDSQLDDGASSEWDAADETAVIYLRLGSASSNYAQIGDIQLNYLAGF